MRERIGIAACMALAGFLLGSIWGWQTAILGAVLFALAPTIGEAVSG